MENKTDDVDSSDDPSISNSSDNKQMDTNSNNIDIYNYDTCKDSSGSIKCGSLFTKFFNDILVTVNRSIDDNRVKNSSLIDENSYYIPVFIDFLMERFMPYCFIWSSLILQDMNPITRWTNGTV